MEEMKVDSILEEIKEESFIESAKEKKVEKKAKKVENNKNMVKASDKQKKHNKVDKKTRNYFAKNIALMIATAICGYFKLMSPVLYIPIEIIGLCAISYKCGEVKGRMMNDGKIA